MAEALREIGFLQIRAGDKTAAVQYLEKYLELQPDAPDVARVRAVRDALVQAAQKSTGP
jgi:regulator of sirC expression with transglutaminase-like and TPR domain